MGNNHTKHTFLLTSPVVTMDATDEAAEPTWPELLGSNNWEGLLDPPNLSLRKLIIRCGDFCQATYDAFNNDPNSKYCGSSRYGKASFFDKVMFEAASDYQVVSFLYATAAVSHCEAFLLHSKSRESWDRESNWMGYIAVTNDEASAALGRREIHVAFRGTTRSYEWIDVLGAKFQSVEPLLCLNDSHEGLAHVHCFDEKVPKVMRGWLTMYISEDPKSPFSKKSLRAQLLVTIKELMKQYKGEELSVTLTGHSLGASLAVLSAFDLVENGVSDIPVAAIVFGCPRVGNKAFNERCKKHPNLNVLHVKNALDKIPHYPGRILGYEDTGIELVIDTRKSPYLKESQKTDDLHNLQAMLHMVAGWNGKKGEFELKVKRSLGLVNKSCDFLKHECLIPASWWVEKNKGLVLDENGEWVAPPPEEEDLPVPEF